MIRLDNRQVIALSVAFALIALCILGTWFAVAARDDALQELAERQAQLAQIETAQTRRGTTVAATPVNAPEAAFLNASTAALAGAQLQANLTRLVAAQHANLASSGILDSPRAEAGEVVRLQVSFDMGLIALQKLLYEIETRTPYIFVEALAIQPRDGMQMADGEPLLHVTIGVRALWRRTTI